MPMKTLTRPSRMARIAATVSPCARGLVMPNSQPPLGTARIFSQTSSCGPLVLECLRTGHTPAGFADHAPQQQHVGDLTDGGHGVGVLGQAHSPADDRAATPSTSRRLR